MKLVKPKKGTTMETVGIIRCKGFVLSGLVSGLDFAALVALAWGIGLKASVDGLM